MTVLFTVWGYDLTAVECAALLLALPAVGLGITGSRWTWPPAFLSSLLYCWLFVDVTLFASAALQVVFMLASVWGWFSWGREGVVAPSRLTLAGRIRGAVGILVLGALVAPLLQSMDDAATWGDAFVLVGSLAGQLLMVLQKTETWPVWMTVNIVGAVLYASQGLYFTSLFYAILFFLAGIGWREWSGRSAAHTVAPPAAGVTARRS